MTDIVDVAIIGGGLAGASAGCAFGDAGLDVKLFERRDLSRDPNRGDILHPPSIDIARRLGAFERVEARGAVGFHSIEVTDRRERLRVRSEVQPCRILNHSELEAVFMETAEQRGVVVESEAARALRREGGAWLIETDRGTTSARFLVGADGSDSFTRRTLGIPVDGLVEYEESIVVLHAPRPDWLEEESGLQVVHPAGGVFVLPTTPNGRVRLVVMVRRSEGKIWATSSEADLQERLAARYERLAGISITKRGGSHVYRLRRAHAARYSQESAALTGDAAHTIHPMGGQGLNLAIQDSAALAEVVLPLLKARSDEHAMADALDAYEARRRPINAGTIGWAHWSSRLTRPGRLNYLRALRFYRRARRDPGHVLRFSQRFGGRE